MSVVRLVKYLHNLMVRCGVVVLLPIRQADDVRGAAGQGRSCFQCLRADSYGEWAVTSVALPSCVEQMVPVVQPAKDLRNLLKDG